MLYTLQQIATKIQQCPFTQPNIQLNLVKLNQLLSLWHEINFQQMFLILQQGKAEAMILIQSWILEEQLLMICKLTETLVQGYKYCLHWKQNHS